MKTDLSDHASLSFVVAVFLACNLSAQTPVIVTVEVGKSLAVQTNQIVSVVGYDYQNEVVITGTFADGNQVTMSPRINGQSPVLFSGPTTQTFTGLTNIAVVYPNLSGSYNGGAATFEVKTQACENPNSLPVIPQGRAALVQVQSHL